MKVGACPAGGRSIRPGRAGQPPAALTPGAACPKAHRSQNPPPQCGDAALRAGTRGGLAGNRWPGRHIRHAISGSPRGDPLHGLDDVVETRARHVAPSPGQALTRDRCHRGHPGPPPRLPRARLRRQRRRNLPPRSTEQLARGIDTTVPSFPPWRAGRPATVGGMLAMVGVIVSGGSAGPRSARGRSCAGCSRWYLPWS